jgi:hypothetical protein
MLQQDGRSTDNAWRKPLYPISSLVRLGRERRSTVGPLPVLFHQLCMVVIASIHGQHRLAWPGQRTATKVDGVQVVGTGGLHEWEMNANAWTRSTGYTRSPLPHVRLIMQESGHSPDWHNPATLRRN